MTPRADWSTWSISESVSRQIPDGPPGATEMRVYITCPHCNYKIDTTAATAVKNRGVLAKRHLSGSRGVKCQNPPEGVPLDMPASTAYVPKADVHKQCAAKIEGLQTEIRETRERLQSEFQGDIASLNTKVDKLKANVHAIHEALGASPPHSSDDESAVVARVESTLKRVRDQEKSIAGDELRVRLAAAVQEESVSRDNMEKTLQCNVCCDRPSNVLVTRCGHVSVCNQCIERDFEVRWGGRSTFRCYHCNKKAKVTDICVVHVV